MNKQFNHWWAENHLKYQGITDAQALEIWTAAQESASNAQH